MVDTLLTASYIVYSTKIYLNSVLNQNFRLLITLLAQTPFSVGRFIPQSQVLSLLNLTLYRQLRYQRLTLRETFWYLLRALSNQSQLAPNNLRTSTGTFFQTQRYNLKTTVLVNLPLNKIISLLLYNYFIVPTTTLSQFYPTIKLILKNSVTSLQVPSYVPYWGYVYFKHKLH